MAVSEKMGSLVCDCGCPYNKYIYGPLVWALNSHPYKLIILPVQTTQQGAQSSDPLKGGLGPILGCP